jgi:YHS domain-containing protein
MRFLGRVLRFLFWVFVVSWAVKLLGRAIGATARTQGTAPEQGSPQQVNTGRRLVKDPVCGMHLAEELALPLNANGEVLHFCSQECRSKYESSLVRAASA